MKSFLLALTASTALSASAMAASNVECGNAEGFQVSLNVADGSALGTLTYGQADDLTSVSGVETALINGVGAAVKGGEVLFVVTAAQPANLGQLVVEGTTYNLTCK